jgi:ABC-type multidrug transport system fused ATPase/permease subunit
MFQPWVLKYVVDGLKQSLNREKLFVYAGLILGLSIVEGFFRFWMRKILIGVSRDIEYDLRNDFLAHVQTMSLSFLQSRSTGASYPGRPTISIREIGSQNQASCTHVTTTQQSFVRQYSETELETTVLAAFLLLSYP